MKVGFTSPTESERQIVTRYFNTALPVNVSHRDSYICLQFLLLKGIKSSGVSTLPYLSTRTKAKYLAISPRGTRTQFLLARTKSRNTREFLTEATNLPTSKFYPASTIPPKKKTLEFCDSDRTYVIIIIITNQRTSTSEKTLRFDVGIS